MKKFQIITTATTLLALLTSPALAEKVEELSEITISGTQEQSTDSSLGSSGLDESGLASRRAATSDSASLLQDVPGVSLYGAGGISSLPAIHGLSDDR